MAKLLAAFCLAVVSLPAFAGSVEVRIEKMQFVPQEVRIKAGDSVVWKSYEKRGYHSVWFKAEDLAESDPLFMDETWQRKFERKGEYPYLCGPHHEMTGVVVVE